MAGRGIYSTFHNLSIQFDSTPIVVDKLKSMLYILKEDMRISDLYYVAGTVAGYIFGTGMKFN